MPVHLVWRAIEQSRTREPLVRAMVLMCGARVLAAVDKKAANEVYAEGVATAEALPLDVRHRRFILHEAVRLGAAADPVSAAVLFRRLPSDEYSFSDRSIGTMVVQSLAQSGEFETALGLLEDPRCETGGAPAIVHFASDPAVQRRAMLAARERWRASRKRSDQPGGLFGQDEFYRLFSQYWRRLQPDEAEAWLDEILLAIATDPDRPARAGYGQRVELRSMRDMHLFEVLNVVRAVKPAEQVEMLLHGHPDVAEAAKVYPLGLESLMTQPRPAREGGQAGRTGGIGFSGSGSRRGGRLMASTIAAHRGDPAAVQHLLSEAHHLYLEDLNPEDPNIAPRVWWPSCHAYQLAMYWAGKRQNGDAERLLAEIPDSDFALLASIEFAAGALGLSQQSGVRLEHHPKRIHRA